MHISNYNEIVIDRNNIHNLFTQIDKCLEQKAEKYDLIIFGSGALLIQGICRDDRITMDIDLVEPKMNMTLQLIASEIGEKYGMDMKWLNSAGHIFAKNFPNNWKDRTKLIFKGNYITVKVLGRQDLIATKCYSYCMRNLNTDKSDLIDLKPSEKELNFAKKWILSLKDCPKKKFITVCFKELLHHPINSFTFNWLNYLTLLFFYLFENEGFIG